MRFLLTGGGGADCARALALPDGAAAGAEAVIPPRPDRREQRGCDRALYGERNRIERMFAGLRQFRGTATGHAKLAVSFMGFLHLAAILLWPK